VVNAFAHLALLVPSSPNLFFTIPSLGFSRSEDGDGGVDDQGVEEKKENSLTSKNSS
jgi:hypothetical protein